MANKVSGWKEKLLTSTGKEILIKAIAQAMPSYTMSCFLLPNILCDDLAGMTKQFWWGQANKKKETSLVKLGKAVHAKRQRGFGLL